MITPTRLMEVRQLAAGMTPLLTEDDDVTLSQTGTGERALAQLEQLQKALRDVLTVVDATELASAGLAVATPREEIDREVNALRTCLEYLYPLDDSARDRALEYLQRRFHRAVRSTEPMPRR